MLLYPPRPGELLVKFEELQSPLCNWFEKSTAPSVVQWIIIASNYHWKVPGVVSNGWDLCTTGTQEALPDLLTAGGFSASSKFTGQGNLTLWSCIPEEGRDVSCLLSKLRLFGTKKIQSNYIICQGMLVDTAPKPHHQKHIWHLLVAQGYLNSLLQATGGYMKQKPSGEQNNGVHVLVACLLLWMMQVHSRNELIDLYTGQSSVQNLEACSLNQRGLHLISKGGSGLPVFRPIKRKHSRYHLFSE